MNQRPIGLLARRRVEHAMEEQTVVTRVRAFTCWVVLKMEVAQKCDECSPDGKQDSYQEPN